MFTLHALIASSTSALWGWYTPRLMEIVNFPNLQFGQVGGRGVCPHCSFHAYFKPVTSAHTEPRREGGQWICNAAQCESCKGFVLVVGQRNPRLPNDRQDWHFEGVYPLGKPNDSVASEVPPQIAEDFREALRCEWVRAYKATVTMCRRAVQGSCVELKATDGKLQDQIDYLATKGIITDSLKKMAHRVRLTGNEGAHPGKDGLNDISPQDAKDIIDFTREFFHHVFVVPAKLAKWESERAAVANPAKS